MLDTVKEVLVKEIEVQDVKDVLLADIEMKAIKEVLLKEIDVSKLKESLISEIKETLLKEIDVSVIKEALTKEIDVSVIKDVLTKEIEFKDLLPRKEEIVDPSQSNRINREGSNAKEKIKNTKVDLPAYKYGLIDSFKEDHQELLSIYDIIEHLVKEREYATLPLMLSKFSKKCLDHFSDEEELYAYMKSLAGNRSEIEKKVATEFSAEMKNLSVSLFSILNQSNNIPVNDNTVGGFLVELGELGEVLKERIWREERILYPLYENNRKVVDIC